MRTEFGGNLTVADPLPAYADTPVGQLRQFLKNAPNLTDGALGDPARVAAVIIDSADTTPAPRRLALDSDACEAIRVALTGRLDELEAGKDIARSTDFSA